MNFRLAILTLKMKENKQHFQHIMLCYFKKGKNATETQKKVCALYGEGAVTDQLCQKWFAKFHFMLEISRWMIDTPWSSRPVEVDSDQIRTLIENK